VRIYYFTADKKRCGRFVHIFEYFILSRAAFAASASAVAFTAAISASSLTFAAFLAASDF
jgi:hypothetical protein